MSNTNLLITKYDDTQKNIWDEFVRSNPYSWVGHLSGIFAIEQATRGADNFSLMVFDNQKQLLAILPLFLTIDRELKFLKKRILSSGTHLASGILIAPDLGTKRNNNIIKLLMDNVNEICKQEQVEEVRIGYPNIIDGKASLNHYGFFPLKQYGFVENNVVTMIKALNGEEEQLFNSLKKDCRRNISKCYKEDVKFQEIHEKEQWLNCYDLNVQTLGSGAYSRKAMEIIWDEFVDQGTSIVTALVHRDKIINVEVSACWRDWFYLWLGFSTKPYSLPGAGHLSLWETILYHKQKGFKLCEVGSMHSTPGKSRNISRFKESFTGTPIYMLSGKLRFRPIKSQVVETLNLIKNNSVVSL